MKIIYGSHKAGFGPHGRPNPNGRPAFSDLTSDGINAIFGRKYGRSWMFGIVLATGSSNYLS